MKKGQSSYKRLEFTEEKKTKPKKTTKFPPKRNKSKQDIDNAKEQMLEFLDNMEKARKKQQRNMYAKFERTGVRYSNLENSPYKDTPYKVSKARKHLHPVLFTWRDGYQMEWDRRFQTMREDVDREDFHDELKYLFPVWVGVPKGKAVEADKNGDNVCSDSKIDVDLTDDAYVKNGKTAKSGYGKDLKSTKEQALTHGSKVGVHTLHDDITKDGDTTTKETGVCITKTRRGKQVRFSLPDIQGLSSVVVATSPPGETTKKMSLSLPELNLKQSNLGYKGAENGAEKLISICEVCAEAKNGSKCLTGSDNLKDKQTTRTNEQETPVTKYIENINMETETVEPGNTCGTEVQADVNELSVPELDGSKFLNKVDGLKDKQTTRTNEQETPVTKFIENITMETETIETGNTCKTEVQADINELLVPELDGSKFLNKVDSLKDKQTTRTNEHHETPVTKYIENITMETETIEPGNTCGTEVQADVNELSVPELDGSKCLNKLDGLKDKQSTRTNEQETPVTKFIKNITMESETVEPGNTCNTEVQSNLNELLVPESDGFKCLNGEDDIKAKQTTMTDVKETSVTKYIENITMETETVEPGNTCGNEIQAILNESLVPESDGSKCINQSDSLKDKQAAQTNEQETPVTKYLENITMDKVNLKSGKNRDTELQADINRASISESDDLVQKEEEASIESDESQLPKSGFQNKVCYSPPPRPRVS